MPDRPNRFRPSPGRFQLVPLNNPDASAVQLICSKCSARPRLSREKLAELAEQAMAAGRHDAYAA